MPVVVVTGFLGAGKTTLLRRFLASAEGALSAVVVNEFGEVPLDQALLAEGAAETRLLGNGCLCCTLRTDLETTFRQLFADRQAGRVPPFRRVLLELSGADDPLPVLQTLLGPRALGAEYHLQAVVAVVDATTAAHSLAVSPEARRQVALADRIVMSKTDIADPADATAALCAHNPAAPLLPAAHGAVPPEFLLADGVLPALRVADAPTHVQGLASFTLRWPAPVPWPALRAALSLLAERRGADLLRVKGLAAVEGCAGPVVVQAVQHLLHPPVELQSWPAGTAPGTALTCITRNGLDAARVLAVFNAVLALG